MSSIAESPAETPMSPIKKRLVCYLSGFDPQGPAHYHHLFVTEAAKQAALAGYGLEVGQRRKGGDHMAYWDLRGRFGDATVETRYEFLRWDDIVRQHWPRGRVRLVAKTISASISMWANGVMWKSFKTSWPMAVAIMLPGFGLCLGLLALGLLAGAVLGLWAHQAKLASLLLLAGGLPALLWAAVVAERRTQMAWLMRSLACLVRQGRSQMPDLEARLDAFANHVAQAAAQHRFDEILIVGHSSGAMLAMIVAERAWSLSAENGSAAVDAPVSLLTLGHCTPLLSYQPEAERFRAELTRLVRAHGLRWVDYSAPADGCCFALRDPTRFPGAGSAGTAGPKLLNARFAELFSSESYRVFRADKFRCHFQYLSAGQIAGSYDFFAIVAGPLDLGSRHAGQPSVTDYRHLQRFGGPGF